MPNAYTLYGIACIKFKVLYCAMLGCLHDQQVTTALLRRVVRFLSRQFDVGFTDRSLGLTISL